MGRPNADPLLPAAIPSLPSEVVQLIVSHTPVVSLKRVLGVSRDWAAAARSDFLWLAILRRRWPSFTPSGRFATAELAFHALRNLGENRGVSWPAGAMLNVGSLRSGAAQRFLLGLINGFMPAADGCFTYHEASSTPIHYRMAPDYEEWQWSPDRCEWFSTASTEISRGVFAIGGEWTLVDANEEIVEFLESWPLQPLFTRPFRVNHQCPYDGSWWAATLAWSVDLNTALREDFEYAVFDEEPTVPCAEQRTFVLHQYLESPLTFGAHPAESHVLADSNPSCQIWLPTLLERRIIVWPTTAPAPAHAHHPEPMRVWTRTRTRASRARPLTPLLTSTSLLPATGTGAGPLWCGQSHREALGAPL